MKLRVRRPLALVALIFAALAQAAAPAWAQTPQPVEPMHVNLASTASQSLSIPRGKSAVVDLPVDAREVLVTNPQVADAVLRTPRRIYVMGISTGVTDAVFFDAAGRRILALN
jgi:pilus assembly protein CpaC